ncbi:MAG: type IX secretion system membrane protein PorP/SprF, partial [Chitinophagales bacterium]
MTFGLKNALLLLMLCVGFIPVMAQIQPITSHYMFNPQVVNPAFYGSHEGIRFGANYRHQWAKLEGQPKTIHIFSDAYLPQAHGAVGLQIS